MKEVETITWQELSLYFESPDHVEERMTLRIIRLPQASDAECRSL
jgi:hypothetical protein